MAIPSIRWARTPRLAVILGLLLLVSVVANLCLAWLARDQYRKVLRVRLDPSSEAVFAPLNASLTPPAAGLRRLVFFGDSRIAMWQSLPTVAGCQVVNRGMGNDTSGQLLLRVERDVIALHPDLVFLEIGANDLKSLGALHDEVAAIEARLRSNVFALLDRLRAGGIPVVVSTVFPFGDVSLPRRPIWSERVVEARDEWNQEIRQWHRPGVTVFDADVVLASNGRLKPEFQRDELHLNEAAYEALNAAVPACLERALNLPREASQPATPPIPMGSRPPA